MSMMIVFEKFMSKKENDFRVDKLIKLPILVMWINKKKQRKYIMFHCITRKLIIISTSLVLNSRL